MTGGKRRAFLVEDEPLILMMLESMMENLGYEIAGTAATLDQGVAALANGALYDIAVLDINLRGEASYPLADRLRDKGVPVLFASGYGRRGLAAGYEDRPVVQKPYDERTLEAALAGLPSSSGA